jgi:hypothetical protein
LHPAYLIGVGQTEDLSEKTQTGEHTFLAVASGTVEKFNIRGLVLENLQDYCFTGLFGISKSPKAISRL